RGGRVLGHAAAGEPARGARLRAERRAREPPRPHRALDGASPPLPPAAGPAAADVDGLPPRPLVDRVLDAPGAPPARARAVRADAGGVAAAAPAAVSSSTCGQSSPHMDNGARGWQASLEDPPPGGGPDAAARDGGGGCRQPRRRPATPGRPARRRFVLTPRLRRLAVPRTHRLVASRYPPAGIFDAICTPGDLAAIADLEGWTNDRLQAELGQLHLFPKSEWVVGVPNASVVMAAFCHPSKDGARFTSAELGAWYAAFELPTAHREVAYHRRREFDGVRRSPSP